MEPDVQIPSTSSTPMETDDIVPPTSAIPFAVPHTPHNGKARRQSMYRKRKAAERTPAEAADFAKAAAERQRAYRQRRAAQIVSQISTPPTHTAVQPEQSTWNIKWSSSIKRERKVHHSGIVAASENVTTPECVLTEQIASPAAAGRRAAPRDPRPGAAAAGDRENIFKVEVKDSINNQIESQGSQDYNDGEVKKPTEVIYNKQEYLIGTHYHCKECNADIVGFRYTCVECADYHVCAACEACEAHAHHYVLRVPADKPHDEAMAMVERIRQLIDIREQDNPETPIGEIESFKSEIDIDEDPLEGAYKVKIEPEETDVLEAAPQTDHQDTFPSHVTTIKEYAQTAEPRASKRKKCSDALADMPPVTRPQLDTQSRTSIDRASEVSSKRSKTKKESAPISSSSNINKQTHKTCAVQSTVPNLYVPGTSDPALGSAGPILRYDIQNPASNQRSPPELLYSPPTRSAQAQLRPCDLTQPIEEFFIKTEFPD